MSAHHSLRLEPPRSWRSRLGLALIIALIHYLLARLSLEFLIGPSQISAFWIPEGFLIGALALSPRRMWPLILAVVLPIGALGDYQIGKSLSISLGLVSINCLEAYLGAWMLTKTMADPYRPFHLRDILWVFGAVSALPSLLGGLAAAAILSSTISPGHYWTVWQTWTTATFVGIVMMLPLTLAIARLVNVQATWSWGKRAEFAALTLSGGVVTEVIFIQKPTTFENIGPLSYLPYPFIIWSAIRFGTLGASLSLFIVSLVAVAYTSQGRGPMAAVASDAVQVLIVQAYLAITAACAQLLAAASAERETAAEHTALAEERYRSLVEQASDGIFVTDENGKCLEVNRAGYDMLGYSREEVVGRSVYEFVAPEDLAANPPRVAEIRRSGALMTERTLLRKDGGRLPVEVHAKALPDGRIIGIYRDLRERRFRESIQRAMSLGDGQHRTGFFVALVRDLAQALDARGAWIGEGAGPTSRTLASFPQDGAELGSEFPFPCVDPDGAPMADEPDRERESLLEAFNAQAILAVELKDSGGEVTGCLAALGSRDFEASESARSILNLFATRAGAELERIRGEEALLASEARQRALLQAFPDTFFVMTKDGVYLDYHTRDESRLLIPPDGFLGRSYREVMPRDMLPQLDRVFEALRRGKRPKVYEYSTKAKGVERTYEVRHVAVGDGLVLAILRDVSQRKQDDAEIKRLNENLERLVAERTIQLEAANKELESFAYSVSHDLRAPMRAIQANAEILREDLGSRATFEDLENLTRITLRAREMAELVDGLLKLSRIMRADLQREDVDLTAIAKDTLGQLMRHESRRRLEIRIQEGVHAAGDRVLLTAALRNLLDNAFKFTSKKESASIEFGCMEKPEGPVYFVKDTGAGFDMSYSSKLFGAFERLHAPGEFPGTGIGLATVMRIIHRHGGLIWAESEPGQGAAFFFTLGH